MQRANANDKLLCGLRSQQVEEGHDLIMHVQSVEKFTTHANPTNFKPKRSLTLGSSILGEEKLLLCESVVPSNVLVLGRAFYKYIYY
ncbi:hypothetical protein M3Y97_00471900 [Aphelenchoides bicaudatus]|nr:hypothetical protein M3Y97_00471900 [Aphelenchoides bicaudatus]